MLKDNFTKAYNYACLLLKYSDRTETELVQRLKKKNFSENIIKQVIKKLKEANFLSEERFVKSFISKNLKKGKSLKLTLYELKVKHNIIPDENILKNFDTNNTGIVIDVIKKNFGEKISSDAKTLNKLQNFLLRRGYDYSEIESLINKITEYTKEN